MAKGKQSKPSSSHQPVEGKRETLQAVILADSFDESFKPLTIDTPRALIKLAGSPLINYTLDFLVRNGVEEIFVLTCAHADRINEHILNSRFVKYCKSIATKGIGSLGDALREIDSANVIKDDFVLLPADVVANTNLRKRIMEHKQRRKKDKSIVMTSLFRELSLNHPGLGARSVWGIDDETKQVVYHKSVGDYAKKGGELRIPTDILFSTNSASFRADLYDADISICSPNVPALFADQFDYLSKNDFIKGVLVNEAVLGNKIFCSIEKGKSYLNRASSLQRFDHISMDVLSRWTYPIVPDFDLSLTENWENGVLETKAIEVLRNNVYKMLGSTLQRRAVLERNVLLGEKSMIGEDSVLSWSVVGNGCRIGVKSKVEHCYIGWGVSIGDNCVIKGAFIGDNVTIADNVTIEPGCVIGNGLSFGNGATIPPGTRIISKQTALDMGATDMDNCEATKSSDEFGFSCCGDMPRFRSFNESICGVNSNAVLFLPPETDDDNSESSTDSIDRWLFETNWAQHWYPSSENDPTPTPNPRDNVNYTGEDQDLVQRKSRRPSFRPSQLEDQKKTFYAELQETIGRAVEENVSPENTVVEINSSKHAYNIIWSDLNSMVVRAALDVPLWRAVAAHDETKIAAFKSLDSRELLKRYKHILRTLLPVINVYIKDAKSQLDCINSLASYITCNQTRLDRLLPISAQLVHFMYDEDVLSEDVLLRWYAGWAKRAGMNDREKKFVDKLKPVIDWLEQASEEDSEE